MTEVVDKASNDILLHLCYVDGHDGVALEDVVCAGCGLCGPSVLCAVYIPLSVLYGVCTLRVHVMRSNNYSPEFISPYVLYVIHIPRRSYSTESVLYAVHITQLILRIPYF